MKRKICAIALSIILLAMPCIVAKGNSPVLYWNTVSQVSQSVRSYSDSALCEYYIRAYSGVTKIVASGTLYEKRNGVYRYVDSWTDTFNNYYGMRSSWRSTKGGSCKYIVTYTTYIGGIQQERFSIERTG